MKNVPNHQPGNRLLHCLITAGYQFLVTACSQPLKHAAAIHLREIRDQYRALQKDAQLPHQGKIKSWSCPIINQGLYPLVI